MKIRNYILAALFLALYACGGGLEKIDRTKAPLPGPAPQINLGTYDKFTLDNGLKVIVVENHKLPRVSFQLFIDSDPVKEEDKAGYVSMAGQMLKQGTSSKTKAQIDEDIDFIGASLNTNANGMFGSSLKKHSNTLLTIMSDILLNPSFPEDELEKIRKQTISSLATAKNDANTIASNLRAVLNYGKEHPYGEIVTEETVKNISVEDCKKYYNTYFKPNISYLIVVGDITKTEAETMANKYFGNWKKGEVKEHKYDVPQLPKFTTVDFVDKPGAVQSTIAITYPIEFKPGNPDAIKASVMNNILGGGVFSGRLMQNLREDKAYTYGARSSLSSDPIIGEFNAGASVRNEVTDSSITQFIYEMRRIIVEEVDEKDLQLVKNSMNGRFARSLESPQTIARFALNIARYNLPPDYYATYLEKLSKVSVADVLEMAEKYIKPENAHIIVVGNKKEVADKLGQFSADGKVHFYDMYGNDWVDLKPAPEGVTAETVINGYIDAIGGIDRLSKLKSLKTEMTAKMMGQTINITTLNKAPNKFKTEMKMGAMVVQKQVFDGKKGKASGMQGSQEITGEDLEDLKLQSTLNMETKWKELGYNLKLLGIENINGKDAYKVEVNDPLGNTYWDYFDIETNLKIKSLRVEETPQGAMTIETNLSDYREVDGIKYPYVRSQSFGPQSLDMTVTKIEVNKTIADSEFAIE